MDEQQINFNRVSDAINFIRENFKSQPSLEEVAKKIHLSPFHFQRIFSEWAGTTPKKFLQYISIEHAKKILKENKASLFDTSIETGLSGTGRLHDLFIGIEGMTPGEFKNGGKNLVIKYSFENSPFGKIIVASTSKGICHLAFAEEEASALSTLKLQFPKAAFHKLKDEFQQNALTVFDTERKELAEIKLHLKGTNFQIKVWEALLKIPMGTLTTYGNIAGEIKMPKAARAVGTAIGDNPVAFLIPCHRVIRSGGEFGGYHWGSNRKTVMIGWETARTTIE